TFQAAPISAAEVSSAAMLRWLRVSNRCRPSAPGFSGAAATSAGCCFIKSALNLAWPPMVLKASRPLLIAGVAPGAKLLTRRAPFCNAPSTHGTCSGGADGVRILTFELPAGWLAGISEKVIISGALTTNLVSDFDGCG